MRKPKTAVISANIVVLLYALQTRCFDCVTFRPKTSSSSRSSAFGSVWEVRESKTNVFSGIGNSNSGIGDNDNYLLASLKKRADELEIQNEALLSRWKNAKCISKARLVIDDWVRRVSLGKWPYLVMGSARGSIYLADCNTCKVVAEVKEVHNAEGGNEEALRYLYGPYDGGGTLAIAMSGNVIASAGREGGVKVFHVTVTEEDVKNPTQKKIVPVGDIPSLKGSLVTSLLLDTEQKLWVGSYDGTLHMFDLDYGSAQKNATLRVESGVLCVDVNTDIGLVVCGMKNGSVKMFSVDGAVLALWKPFSSTHVRSVKIVGGPDDSSWCVVAGGGDGNLMARQLLVDSTGTIETVPFDNKRGTMEFSPPHGGTVVAMAERSGGLLITGAQDGTIRVWDCWQKSSVSDDSNYSSFQVKPEVLYNFVGYKVWLGSICNDGNCLLSDGSDNSIIVHDFTVPINYD
jgi:WD40 repeat protein